MCSTVRSVHHDADVRVLVVEDEIELAKLIRQGLMAEGQLADVAVSGEDALWMAAATPYTAICLDIGLPGIDGLETCRRLRAGDIATPIIMLTARDAVADRIAGLNAGADDYLVKPFAFGELLARLHALARRPAAQAEPRAAGRRPRARPGDATACERAGSRSTCPSSSCRSSRSSCATPARCSAAPRCSRARGTRAMRTARTSSTSTCARCARRSTGRSGCETLETVRGAGYRLRAAWSSGRRQHERRARAAAVAVGDRRAPAVGARDRVDEREAEAAAGRPVRASAWLKRSNARGRKSGGKPGPPSWTTSATPSGAAAPRSSIVPSP